MKKTAIFLLLNFKKRVTLNRVLLFFIFVFSNCSASEEQRNSSVNKWISITSGSGVAIKNDSIFLPHSFQTPLGYLGPFKIENNQIQLKNGEYLIYNGFDYLHSDTLYLVTKIPSYERFPLISLRKETYNWNRLEFTDNKDRFVLNNNGNLLIDINGIKTKRIIGKNTIAKIDKQLSISGIKNCFDPYSQSENHKMPYFQLFEKGKEFKIWVGEVHTSFCLLFILSELRKVIPEFSESFENLQVQKVPREW